MLAEAVIYDVAGRLRGIARAAELPVREIGAVVNAQLVAAGRVRRRLVKLQRILVTAGVVSDDSILDQCGGAQLIDIGLVEFLAGLRLLAGADVALDGRVVGPDR